MQSDDLLQFKDFSNAPNTTSPPAQINVNSPTHSMDSAGSGGGGGGGGGGGVGGGGRSRGDPLSDLIYDMSNSAHVLSGGMTSSGTGGSGGGGGGGGGMGGSGLPEPATAGSSKASFFTIEFYQRFFDVDTYMVLERIANSIIPKRAPSNYLKHNIGQNPDLYGPFWITTTLIFCIAISGNIASYLQYQRDDYKWRYNFHLVSYAATCIFIYANFVPAALWALFKYSLKPVEEGLETESSDYTPSLLSLMCVYGYSFSIYIPVSILWVIQISILQWLLVITAALLSGSVLIAILTPALRNSKLSLFLVIAIMSAHVLLAAGFMLYFFHVPSDSSAPTTEALKQIVQQAAAAVVTPKAGNLTT